MSTPSLGQEPKTAVVIPFVCPICAGENAVHLISLSRAGGMDCVVCGKWLRSADVMRAMHSPRPARNADSAPVRVPVAGPTKTRVIPSRSSRVTWPPTAATRAAATPLRDEK